MVTAVGCYIYLSVEVAKPGSRFEFDLQVAYDAELEGRPEDQARIVQLTTPTWTLLHPGRVLVDPPGSRWQIRRNYNLFAILANVRNGPGPYSACAQLESFPLRGKPTDMSAALQIHATDPSSFGYLGEHSFSYLSLADIDQFDWTKQAACVGYLPVSRQAYAYDRDRLLTFYEWHAIGRNAPGLVHQHTDNQHVLEIAEALELRLDRPKIAEAYKPNMARVRITWSQSYAEIAKDFLQFCERRLRPLADQARSPHAVRIVFGFDS